MPLVCCDSVQSAHLKETPRKKGRAEGEPVDGPAAAAFTLLISLQTPSPVQEGRQAPPTGADNSNIAASSDPAPQAALNKSAISDVNNRTGKLNSVLFRSDLAERFQLVQVIPSVETGAPGDHEAADPSQSSQTAASHLTAGNLQQNSNGVPVGDVVLTSARAGRIGDILLQAGDSGPLGATPEPASNQPLANAEFAEPLAEVSSLGTTGASAEPAGEGRSNLSKAIVLTAARPQSPLPTGGRFRDQSNLSASQPQDSEQQVQPVAPQVQTTHSSTTDSVQPNISQGLNPPGAGELGAPSAVAITQTTLPHRLAETLAAQVQLDRQAGDRTFVFRLDPPELGAVLIRMVRDPQGLNIRVTAERDSTLALIRGQVHQIRSALEQTDLRVANLEFTSAGMGTGSFTGQQPSAHGDPQYGPPDQFPPGEDLRWLNNPRPPAPKTNTIHNIGQLDFRA